MTLLQHAHVSGSSSTVQLILDLGVKHGLPWVEPAFSSETPLQQVPDVQPPASTAEPTICTGELSCPVREAPSPFSNNAFRDDVPLPACDVPAAVAVSA